MLSFQNALVALEGFFCCLVPVKELEPLTTRSTKFCAQSVILKYSEDFCAHIIDVKGVKIFCGLTCHFRKRTRTRTYQRAIAGESFQDGNSEAFILGREDEALCVGVGLPQSVITEAELNITVAQTADSLKL